MKIVNMDSRDHAYRITTPGTEGLTWTIRRA